LRQTSIVRASTSVRPVLNGRSSACAVDGANSAKARADAGAAGRRNVTRLRRRAAATTASGKSVET
jgi:hypothetical protein